MGTGKGQLIFKKIERLFMKFMRRYSNFYHGKVLGKFIFYFLFICAFWSKSFAQEEWYLVFANGNAPKRAAFFVDMNSVKTPSTGVKSINFVYVLEEKGSPQYSTVDVEFRCNGDEVREVRALNFTFESTSEMVADVPWKKNANPLLEVVKKLACRFDEFKEVQRNSSENGRVNSDKLNFQLKEKGLNNNSMMPLVGVGFPNFESVLEFLWAKIWRSDRPQRTGIATNTKNIEPNNSADTKVTAKELVEIGADRLKAGDREDALKYFARAIQIDPNYSPPYFYRGYLYDLIGEFELAIASYSTAISKNPNDYASLFNRGLIYFTQKHKFDLAEADFTKVIKTDPQNANAYFTRANLYESWGKDNLAEADRKKFDSLGGNSLPGFQNRRKALFPMAEFDANLAANALKEGSLTIIGKACAYKKEGLIQVFGRKRFDAANVTVNLYPVTPYLEKWYQLRERKENKKTAVFANRESAKYTLNTKTNGKGEFVFSRIKPGKYFIQIMFNFTEVQTKSVLVGADETTDYYQLRDFYTDHSDRLEQFVEITTDGESKRIIVKAGGIGNCR